MCFELYAGLKNPRPEILWKQAAAGVHVERLSDLQAASIRHHFSNPVVQYIGSTSHRGCDFPHTKLRLAVARGNQGSLVDLLREVR